MKYCVLRTVGKTVAQVIVCKLEKLKLLCFSVVCLVAQISGFLGFNLVSVLFLKEYCSLMASGLTVCTVKLQMISKPFHSGFLIESFNTGAQINRQIVYTQIQRVNCQAKRHTEM